MNLRRNKRNSKNTPKEVPNSKVRLTEEQIDELDKHLYGQKQKENGRI